MDRLSSCYDADFYLEEFGATVRGRYYFSAPDAKYYNGPHNFGSSVWRQECDKGYPFVGDNYLSNYSFYSGALPPAVPGGSMFDVVRARTDCDPSHRRVALTTLQFGGVAIKCYSET